MSKATITDEAGLMMQLDLIFDTEYNEPPFTYPDFECNAIIMTKESMRLSAYSDFFTKKFNGITDRTLNFIEIGKNISNKTTMVYPIKLNVKNDIILNSALDMVH